MSRGAVIARAARDGRVVAMAAALAEARASQATIDSSAPLARLDDVELALAIQDDVAAAHRIGGWKCGLPAEGRVVRAPIRAAAIVAAPGPLRLPRPGARIEPELAYIVARDLPSPIVDAGELRRAIGEVRLALEVVRGRFRDPDAIGFAAMLADDLFNEGLVLGPAVDLAAAERIDRIGIGGRTFAARHPAGDPLAPLLWLAGHLAQRGTPLRAGMAVITGAFTPPQPLPPSGAIAVTFGDAGTVVAQFEIDGEAA